MGFLTWKERIKLVWESYPCQRLMKSGMTTIFLTGIALMQEDVRYMCLVPIVEVVRGMVFKHFGWNIDR